MLRYSYKNNIQRYSYKQYLFKDIAINNIKTKIISKDIALNNIKTKNLPQGISQNTLKPGLFIDITSK